MQVTKATLRRMVIRRKVSATAGEAAVQFVPTPGPIWTGVGKCKMGSVRQYCACTPLGFYPRES